MVSEREARTKLEEAWDFLQSDDRFRDFNLSWKSETAGSSATPAEFYQHRRIRFSQEIQQSLQGIVQEVVDDEIRKVFEDETKEFKPYHISNADKETVPLQYLGIEDLPDFERFSALTEEESFRETSYEEAPKPDFQTIRIKQDTTPRLVAFQKFSRRQILGRNWKVKFPLAGGNEEYNIFRDDLMGVPERVDALYFDGVIFVIGPTKFEDIFDYVEEYEAQSDEVMEGLQESDINIHNFSEFYESITNDRRALRKMHKIRNRGLYEDLSRDDVEEIVQEFSLDISVTTNNSGEWGIDIPDMRKKWDVIRILNDDHVLSYLTDGKFQVTGGKEER